MTIGQKVNTFESLDKKNIKLDVTLMSDIHMEGNVPQKYYDIPRAFNALNGGKDYIDAVVMVGDNSMCAQNIENMFFYGVLERINPIKPYYPAMGNHDVGCDDEQFGTFEELRERQLQYLHMRRDLSRGLSAKVAHNSKNISRKGKTFPANVS